MPHTTRHVLTLLALTAPAASASEQPLLFERDVRPLLARRCFTCHGDDKPKANLDLRTVGGMLRGGDGGPVLVRGDPEGSPLLGLVAKGEMPPGKRKKLAPAEVDLLRRWVRQGARANEKVAVPALVSPHDRQFCGGQAGRGL